MMEESEPRGDDAEVTDGTEEDSPPEEVGSESNDGGARPAEATLEVAMETEQSEELPGTSPPSKGEPVVVQGNQSSASETFQRVRRWSVSKYKRTRQALSEKLGRGSRTVDLDLQPRLDLLKDDQQRYGHMTKLAQLLAGQLTEFSVTQKALGDAFTELSMKTPPLHVEFGMIAEAQKFLSKSGETLTAAINAFTFDMDTLVNKTIEDTMINARQYETARMEYDAYRVDLEELNLGPRDAATLPRLEDAQSSFQGQRDRYQQVRDDLSVKVRLLEENRVKVLHNQLWLLQSAVAANSLSCHSFLERNLQEAVEKLDGVGEDAPSWLEES
ncbi:arfaptin-1-like [Cololabis saira]|uniref:arfaptin-1-like n=1 Tax=Cololabis saira TaxID=129043 RepID=UPI002AD58039|nr:arfaptin-1-like [Cololabis saira]